MRGNFQMDSQISSFSASYDVSKPKAGSAQQPVPLINGLQALTDTSGMLQPPGSETAPITDLSMPQAMTAESMQYLNGFLRTQIGNRVTVNFLIGTNTYIDKSGKLLAVGANYIVLQEAMTDDLLVCDFFNIKFITIYR